MVDVTTLNPATFQQTPQRTRNRNSTDDNSEISTVNQSVSDTFNQHYFESHLPAASSSYSCFADRNTGHVPDTAVNDLGCTETGSGGSTFYVGSVPTLKFLALRRIGLGLFQANVKTGDLRRARRDVRFWTMNMPVPLKYRRQILEVLREVLHEATKWLQQHAALFLDRQNRRGFFQEDHLRLYVPCLVWTPNNLLIIALETCQNIWQEISDWPLMRFRFACCYALVSELKKFTALRLKSMMSRLGDHPLYNFWYFYLQEKRAHERLFDTDSLVPRALVSSALQWALENGHTQLVQFFWKHITPEQAEYMGMLKWRKMCLAVTHVPLFEWLCVQLCKINTIAMARITWNQFYGSLFQLLNTAKQPTVEEQAQMRVHTYKLRYLLTHCCGRMRWALLTLQHCHALNALFMYRDHVLMDLVLEHIEQQELKMVIGYFETLVKISNGKMSLEDNPHYMVVDKNSVDYLYKFLKILKSRVCDDDDLDSCRH